jgi:hypothetical protein
MAEPVFTASWGQAAVVPFFPFQPVPSCGRAVYVVLYLKVDPANARKHKEEPSRTPTTTTIAAAAAGTTINDGITTTIATTYISTRVL